MNFNDLVKLCESADAKTMIVEIDRMYDKNIYTCIEGVSIRNGTVQETIEVFKKEQVRDITDYIDEMNSNNKSDRGEDALDDMNAIDYIKLHKGIYGYISVEMPLEGDFFFIPPTSGWYTRFYNCMKSTETDKLTREEHDQLVNWSLTGEGDYVDHIDTENRDGVASIGGLF